MLDKEDTEEEDVSVAGRKRKRKTFPDEGEKQATPTLIKPSRLLSSGSLSLVSTC